MTAAPSTAYAEPDLAPIIQAYNDVTERLKASHDALAGEVCRLREELHEKNKELARRERLTALGRMAAGVAHEIRNPLGGIGLYASVLERDLADRPKQRDIVRKMSAGLRNLESIVSDTLAYAGDADPHSDRVPAAGIVEAALTQVAPQADARGTRIVVDTFPESVELWCDSAQIERALINLVLNAIDAAGRDGHVWVRLGRGACADGLCRIAVEDDGPGIAPEHIHRVFDPFFTAKGAGTGLGLAIVHRIAESNGGSISAGGRSGGGAAFVLAVPLATECHVVDTNGGGH